MNWESVNIINDKGEQVRAIAPVIVSASRSTDIPAFYADWFFHRLNAGHSAWINPFNGRKSYISYKNTRLIVFWSKNPEPLIKHLDTLTDLRINCYVQYTLNDYCKEDLETGLPPLDRRIETFIELSEKLGKGRVVWRFDPLLLTDRLSVDDLLKRIAYIGDRLHRFNEHLVISFIDITRYKRVAANLAGNNSGIREFAPSEMIDLASGLRDLNRRWGFSIGTCAEKTDLGAFGMHHNSCIDEQLIIRYFSHDQKLMDFLGVTFREPDMFGDESDMRAMKSLKDNGQRECCGCIVSKDIGQYGTCPHLCAYCYANHSKEAAVRNHRHHLENPLSETITGFED